MSPATRLKHDYGLALGVESIFSIGIKSRFLVRFFVSSLPQKPVALQKVLQHTNETRRGGKKRMNVLEKKRRSKAQCRLLNALSASNFVSLLHRSLWKTKRLLWEVMRPRNGNEPNACVRKRWRNTRMSSARCGIPKWIRNMGCVSSSSTLSLPEQHIRRKDKRGVWDRDGLGHDWSQKMIEHYDGVGDVRLRLL